MIKFGQEDKHFSAKFWTIMVPMKSVDSIYRNTVSGVDSVKVNGWPRRSRWSYSQSASDLSKPQLQPAVNLFFTTRSVDHQSYFTLSLHFVSGISTSIFMILTPFKSERAGKGDGNESCLMMGGRGERLDFVSTVQGCPRSSHRL